MLQQAVGRHRHDLELSRRGGDQRGSAGRETQRAEAYRGGEMSSNAGGLLRWPVKLIIPVGFAMLVLQGASEIVKRIAYLRGLIAMDSQYEKPLQ